MKKNLLSIIVPVYNAAAYLQGLFGMLSSQNNRSFEVIFVNDGSEDESLALLTEAAARGEFDMRIIDQSNAGASAARNAGIDAADGDYITFIDADDAITDDFTEIRIKNAFPGGVCVYPHSRVVGKSPLFDRLDGRKQPRTGEEMLRELLMEPTRFGVYDLVIDREFLNKINVRFPEGWKYYEDYDFILRLFNACDTINYLYICSYCYIAAAGSAMNIFNTERLLCLQLFDNIHSLYLENRPEFHADFVKWFAARIKWSVMWQACVAMPLKEALAYGKKAGMRDAMKKLVDYSDKRVSISAAVYLVSPGIYAIIMRRMGKRRTLIPDSMEQ